MSTNVRENLIVATWNLSGGRLARSTGTFDYEPGENLDYFVHELTKIRPDIVCLPETHLIKQGATGRSLTSRLAAKLNFAHIYEAPLHTSHIDSQYTLGLGIISARSFTARNIPLPQPDFPLFFASRRPATNHTRWLIVADFGQFVLSTVHNWPMEVFQHSYDREPGASYGRSIERVYLAALPANKPLIIAGDLNFNATEKVMPQFFRQLNLSEALPPDQPTRNIGTRPDHILYNAGFNCIEADVIQGMSEHYLCYANLEIAYKV